MEGTHWTVVGCSRRKVAAEPWSVKREICDVLPSAISTSSSQSRQLLVCVFSFSFPFFFPMLYLHTIIARCKLRPLQPHLSFFLPDELHVIKMRTRCPEPANFHCRSVVRKQKLLSLFFRRISEMCKRP